MNKPHIWAKEIHAFADGEKIQERTLIRNTIVNTIENKWIDSTNPNFGNDCQAFRVKPKIIAPLTNMTDQELKKLLTWRTQDIDLLREICNTAILRAIEDGQVFIEDR